MGPSVCVVGYLRGSFGTAKFAREIAGALQREVATSVLSLPHAMDSRWGGEPLSLPKCTLLSNADVVIWNFDVNSMAAAFKNYGWRFRKDAVHIAFVFWEMLYFPTDIYPNCFDHINEVWTPSVFVRDAVANVANIPVSVVDVPLTFLSAVQADSTFDIRKKYFLDTKFVFFFNFDYHSSHARKNPDGLVDAFLAAFGHNESTALVIKCSSVDAVPGLYRSHLNSMKKRAPWVHFLEESLSEYDLGSLFLSIDCYVSLHKSEGLGLGMLQAMASGKPVIATNWSGNLDFLTSSVGFPVKYSFCRFGSGFAAYNAADIVACPDIEHAAELMRFVAFNPDIAKRVGNQAAALFNEKYNSERTRAKLTQALRVSMSRDSENGRQSS